MQTKRIGNIILIQLSDMDSNIYLIDDMVIDTGTGFNFPRLYQIFKIYKKTFEDIKFIINTHAHFDHIGGNGFFPNAKIIMHKLDAPVLENGDSSTSYADFFGGQLKKRKVDMKVEEGFELNGLEVIHTPGHTPGSISLYNRKEKILFSGDLIFADGFGRTDLVGGNREDLMKSIEKIKGLEIEKLLPGHGEPVLKMVKERIEFLLKNEPEEV